MNEGQTSLTALLWRYKWCWIVPIGLVVTLFALLVLFSDASGLSPFTYTLF